DSAYGIINSNSNRLGSSYRNSIGTLHAPRVRIYFQPKPIYRLAGVVLVPLRLFQQVHTASLCAYSQVQFVWASQTGYSHTSSFAQPALFPFFSQGVLQQLALFHKSAGQVFGKIAVHAQYATIVYGYELGYTVTVYISCHGVDVASEIIVCDAAE